MSSYTVINYIPSSEPVRFTTVIVTHSLNSTPHLNILLKQNRDTEVYILSENRKILDTDTGNSFNNAITVDVILRDWWRDNYNKVLSKKILYLEYDVLLNLPVHDSMFTDGIMTTTWFSPYNDIPPEKSWETGTWWWRYHGDKLPYELKCKAMQTSCVALWINSRFLDLLIDSRWDQLYKEVIVNEIRIPTIANYHEIPLYNWENKYGLSRSSCIESTITSDKETYFNIKNLTTGVYHPVKRDINIF